MVLGKVIKAFSQRVIPKVPIFFKFKITCNLNRRLVDKADLLWLNELRMSEACPFQVLLNWYTLNRKQDHISMGKSNLVSFAKVR